MSDIKRHIRAFYSEYFAVIVAINLLTQGFSLERMVTKRSHGILVVIDESILTIINLITIHYITVKLNFDWIKVKQKY